MEGCIHYLPQKDNLQKKIHTRTEKTSCASDSTRLCESNAQLYHYFYLTFLFLMTVKTTMLPNAINIPNVYRVIFVPSPVTGDFFFVTLPGAFVLSSVTFTVSCIALLSAFASFSRTESLPASD